MALVEVSHPTPPAVCCEILGQRGNADDGSSCCLGWHPDHSPASRPHWAGDHMRGGVVVRLATERESAEFGRFLVTSVSETCLTRRDGIHA